MAKEVRYLLLDVFTGTALEGNQLAVFPHAHGLSDAEMQALASETNLSETTFCFPGESPETEGVRVRIFTVDEELPFAGHPTLGTAAALRWLLPKLHGAAEVRLRLKVGIVPVRFSPEPSAAFHAAGQPPLGLVASGEMEQPLPRFGQRHTPEAVALALGLSVDAIDREKPVMTVSTGLPFAVVPLRTVDALTSLRISPRDAQQYLAETDAKFFYVIAPEGGDGTAWRARMQFYGGEDPATGSAAGAATAYLVAHGYAPAETPLTIRQGIEIRRPSLIRTEALLQFEADEKSSATGLPESWGKSSYVRVGGSTVLVAEGRFFLQ